MSRCRVEFLLDREYAQRISTQNGGIQRYRCKKSKTKKKRCEKVNRKKKWYQTTEKSHKNWENHRAHAQLYISDNFSNKTIKTYYNFGSDDEMSLRTCATWIHTKSHHFATVTKPPPPLDHHYHKTKPPAPSKKPPTYSTEPRVRGRSKGPTTASPEGG